MTKGERRKYRPLLHRLQDGKCCYCGTKTLLFLPKQGLGVPRPSNFATIEHLRKRSDGGTDHPDNLALACFSCNTERGEMSWVEFKTLKSAA